MASTVSHPDSVYLGDVEFDWKTLTLPSGTDPLPFGPDGGKVTLPLDLRFPSQANLFMSMDSGSRDVALKGLFSTVLRVLCSFPPGKAKFTIFDPTGLGQNFSALMHLADYEESLVGGRIWTETGHFERKLAELTEHIEKVIQKYLRNRVLILTGCAPGDRPDILALATAGTGGVSASWRCWPQPL